MGVDYIYLNQDKKQFFYCGIFGHSSRFSAIGTGPGARALAILLSRQGTWGDNRISVAADTSKKFDDVFLNGVDIEVEVGLMLLDVDGTDWIEERLEDNIIAFKKMCGIAIQLRRPDVMKMLDKVFGKGKWQRKYENHLKGNTDTWSQKIADAGQRTIRLLA